MVVPRKRSKEEFVARLKDTQPTIILNNDLYINNTTKVEVKCLICGHIWMARPDTLLRGIGCPSCARRLAAIKKTKTNEEFLNELQEVNPHVIVLSEYTKAVDRIMVECKNCGHNWEPRAYTLLQGRKCPKCAKRIGASKNKGITGRKTKEQFERNLQKVDPSIKVLGDYVNNKTPIKCKCLRCGHLWEARPDALLKEHGCPKCAKSGTSFMEQYIRICMERNLKTEVKSRDRELIGMELDILIPKMSIAIEPGNWNLHKRHIERDIVKRNRCRENGIRLITIYDVFPNGETPPFDFDCITFSSDYNKADRKELITLINDLFKIMGVENSLTEDDYLEIEDMAYSFAKAMNHDVFIERMNSIHPTIEVIGKYQNTNKRILVRCKKCGFEWNGVPANMLAGDGCRKCGTVTAHERFLKDRDALVEELKTKNPNIEIIGEYNGRHSPIKTRCKICGAIWNPTVSSLLRGSNHKGSVTVHKKLGLK